MDSYRVNKGVGKGAEFKGLKAQYLYMFAIALLGCFLLFIIIYAFGVPLIACFIFIILLVTLVLYYIFDMNKKYGEHGLMKRAARNAEPKLIYQTGKLCRRIREKTEERKKELLEKRKG